MYLYVILDIFPVRCEVQGRTHVFSIHDPRKPLTFSYPHLVHFITRLTTLKPFSQASLLPPTPFVSF
ncbi:hypothetical protein CC2G_007047 [Coprinopsis cinerea AmutBmut pab1-1]|nr:hypothetical protein CC2G_007047 [Coprinopsis cinerea AmutBmut pab1-1]